MQYNEKLKPIVEYFQNKNWKPFEYQVESWNSYLEGRSGLINAPTGTGKTMAAFLGIVAQELNNKSQRSGIKVIWITPLRALAKDVRRALQQICDEFDLKWKVDLRSGDVSSEEKRKQFKTIPDVMVITPESLHVLFTQYGYKAMFKNLNLIVVDEWHELIGNKRGVQVELALSHLTKIQDANQPQIWGISATIGNLNEAAKVLLNPLTTKFEIIKADIKKELQINTVYPEVVEKYTWTGHLGIQLVDQAIEIIENSNTTIVFTNTRNQSELWFRTLSQKRPDLITKLGLHHGSLSNDERIKIEERLHSGDLKAVVATSSLDLGVDFRPVDTVIQVGSPKGVARFLQRAGRSGHSPGEKSIVYFIPTNTLELLEISALKESVIRKEIESKQLIEKPYDVLIQFLITIAVGEGFAENELFEQIKSTYSYQNLQRDEWKWMLQFITKGGKSLSNYNQYNKVKLVNGIYKVLDKKIALRHKVSIGTITSDPSIRIQYLKGSYIGTTESSFISRLNPGSIFWFGGKKLKFEKLEENTAYVTPANSKLEGIVPSWDGGRLPLSTQLSNGIKRHIAYYKTGENITEELKKLKPLLELQNSLSYLPYENELLIERLESEDGYHIFIYSFLGRTNHEGISAIIANRISNKYPMTFSFSMNDYGFELLSDQKIPILFDNNMELIKELFSVNNLQQDILDSVNSTQMAKRKFRDIARISGLVFQGFPGESLKFKNLQISSSLLFDVFKQFEPDSLLYQQSYLEVINQVLNKDEIARALKSIQELNIIVKDINHPSPFSFALIVDSLREKLSSEALENRIEKMTLLME
jgi:ATP-dependent Lhr-like helicase